ARSFEMRWCERFGLGFATCFWAELCSPTRMQQADCGREVVERTADVVRGFKKSFGCLAGLGRAAPCLGAFRRRRPVEVTKPPQGARVVGPPWSSGSSSSPALVLEEDKHSAATWESLPRALDLVPPSFSRRAAC